MDNFDSSEHTHLEQALLMYQGIISN